MEDDALLRCLREHRALFTGGCRAKVMSIERMAHNEMDFNAEVSEACAVELRTQCRGVDSRQQLSCLERMGEVRAAKLAPTCSRVLQGFKEPVNKKDGKATDVHATAGATATTKVPKTLQFFNIFKVGRHGIMS